MKVRYLILGAGPTGLGAARQLQLNLESNWLLVERTPYPGGLAASFVDDRGFTWDIGGHVQFSHYEYFDRAMDQFLGVDGWLDHERESWVWIRNRFIPYPFQNNIRRLPPQDLEECLLGLVEIAQSPPATPCNFQEWIHAKFGPGIAKVFLNPYNFKVWAYPPSDLNSAWVGERVAVTDLRRVLSNLVNERDDLSWGPNNTFRFPKYGGTGAIWRAAAECLPRNKVRFGTKVVALDLPNRRVTLESGEIISYECLVSTLPLDELIRIADATHLLSLVERGLKFSSSHIYGIGLAGQPSRALAKKCWMYFPEDNCPFYRVTVFSNYSPHNVPDSSTQWSLMAEVSASPHKPVNVKTLFDEVIHGLLNTQLIEDSSAIVSRWEFHAKRGYPTPGLHRDSTLAEIIPWLESQHVYSRGRFGLWKYEVGNQDHAFMQGVEIVERLLNGREEITATDPNHANSKKHPWPFERWQGMA